MDNTVCVLWRNTYIFLDMLASLDKDMSQMGSADDMKDVPDKPVNKTTSKTEVNMHTKSHGLFRLVWMCRKQRFGTVSVKPLLGRYEIRVLNLPN